MNIKEQHKGLLRESLWQSPSVIEHLVQAQLKGYSESVSFDVDVDSSATFRNNKRVGSFAGTLRIQQTANYQQAYTFDDLGYFNSEILTRFPRLPVGKLHDSLPMVLKSKVLQMMRFFEEADIRYEYMFDLEAKVQHFSQHPYFYLPMVQTYAEGCIKAGIYIVLIDPRTAIANSSKYFDMIQDYRKENVFVGFDLPSIVSEEDFLSSDKNWLESNMVLAECDDEYYVLEAHYLSQKQDFYDEVRNKRYTDRFKLPIEALSRTLNWVKSD